MKKQGLLLLNLGTPEAPTVPAVRAYLREFLSDPAVIDIPWLFRMLLLYLIILPFRPKKSAAAYAQVWTAEGSPLLVYGRRLEAAVQSHLGDEWAVQLGMRYGRPNYKAALEAMKHHGLTEVVAIPLYPQWASSSSGSTMTAVEAWLEENGHPFKINWVENFFADTDFIDAQAEICQALLAEDDREVHWLFSYHGLPERQVQNVHPKTCLVSDGCCDAVGPQNTRCYRAHAFGTSRALASKLGLHDDQWTIAFQSRLGRAQWLLPNTEDVLQDLVAKGHRDLRVVCPSFVADCLETLEEIDIRGEEIFKEAGGYSFARADCVNDHALFVRSLGALALAAI